MATLVVLGSGIMATALATPFTDNGNEVRLVGTHLDREIIESIKTTGVHPNLNLKVPDGVTAYQLEDAAEAFEGVAESSPVDERQNQEFGAGLEVALRELSELERCCFVLKHVEQWRLVEIADELKISQDSIKQALFRALRKLRIALDPWRSTT